MIPECKDLACDACHPEGELPCPRLADHVLAATRAESAPDAGTVALLAALRRENVLRPTVYVGTGTCGLGAGADRTVAAAKAWLTEHGVEADLVEVGCIGYCSAEPLLDVQLPGRPRLSFTHVTQDKVAEVLAGTLAGTPPTHDVLGQFRAPAHEPWADLPWMDEHPFFAPQMRWVLAGCGNMDPKRIEEAIAHGAWRSMAAMLHRQTPAEVCDTVDQAGLRGRGGGGFRTGVKWKMALAAEADRKYLICNADEGDPGAFMDRAVIEGDPHRLLEGIAIASYGIGASKAYVYIRAEYPLAIRHLEIAIAQAKTYGLLGHDILGSGFNLDVVIKKGAGAFVCGEETALIHSIEGKRGMPRPRPPYPTERGLFGKPTVINNVETLANLPSLLTMGWQAFAAVGTANSKGTKVFALSGKVERTGLVEVAMGTPLRDIVFGVGGGCPNEKKFKAVQIGGPSGGCIPDQHMGILVDYDELKTVGAMMGSGGLVVMDENTCMVDVAKFFMDFIQRESCGKCIPCREGTRRMLETLERITRGRQGETGTDALERFQGVLYLERLGGVIKDTSLCGLGQSAPNPVLSTLRWFKEEYEEHVFDRHCRAGACTDLLTFSIDPDLCNGCTLCARRCPSGAILGTAKSPHYIVPEKCVRCGTCLTDCRRHAVIAA
jgi:NADH:ubiquinone oxidoreductase subunit F (NADH-binding)